MASDSRWIDDLARNVADGTPVNWDAAVSERSGDDAALLAAFRIVEGVARLHREAAGATPEPAVGPDSSQTSAGRSLATPGEDGGTWGPFLLRGRVGRGAFGEVWRAWDPALAREVALKLLPAEPCGELSASSTVAEGRMLARVRHPNVVTVHGVDRVGDTVGLWMEFVRGQSLDQVMEEHGPFSAAEAGLIGLDLCRALSAVHRAGLVHRDVKAQNVMREAGGRTVLMDFGAGCESLAAPVRGLAGTPLYVAPEVLERQAPTVQSDIYSLGVLLFHLVAGSFPVMGKSLAEVEQAHRAGRRRLLRDERPDVPAAFAAVVERALDADPSARFATADEMEAALARSVSDAGTVTLRLPGVSWIRERPVLATAATLLLAVSLGALAWFRPFQAPKGAQATSGFQARGWLLVGRFDNRTGDARLDGSVEYVLEREIGDSRFVNIVPRQRVTDALELMKKPPESQIDEATGREICRRDGGIFGLLTGRVEKLGPRYAVSARLDDPVSGRHVLAASVEAADLGLLYAALRDLANKVRDGLGEAPRDRGREAVELQKVTTPSFEALQLYSRAYALMTNDLRARNKDAIDRLLTESTREDPEFASAYVMLMWQHQKDPKPTWMPFAELALKYSGGATRRERLFIEGSYYHMLSLADESNTVNCDKAIAAYEALVRLYPDDYWGTYNLVAAYLSKGDEVRALPYVVGLSGIRPNSFAFSVRAFRSLWLTGQEAEAMRFAVRARQLPAPETASPFDRDWMSRLDVYERWREGKAAETLAYLEQHFDVGPSGPEWHRAVVANWLPGLGQLSRAAAVESRRDPREASGAGLAWKALLRNDQRAAAELIRESVARRHRSGKPISPSQILTLARSGLATEAAQEYQRDKKARPPGFYLAQDDAYYLGEIAVAAGRYTDAIKHLETVVAVQPKDGYFLLASESLARAYEATGNREAALGVLERAARLKMAVVDNADPGVWLAIQAKRADLLRALDRSSEAEPIEAELRRFLAVADADHPIVRQLALVATPTAR